LWKLWNLREPEATGLNGQTRNLAPSEPVPAGKTIDTGKSF